ncbi:MAG: DUF192 domain-containing protein [Patescibacteria group bacterium UBA2103]
MKIIFYTILLAGFGAMFFYAGSVLFNNQLDSTKIYYAYVNNTPLKVAIANTPETRAKGLSGLESLPQSHGLLFVFDENEKYGIWMKGMNFPIDIMWLNEDFRVVYYKANVPTSSYPKIFYPPTNARYVLETNAGFIEEHGVGERSKLKLISYRPAVFNFGGLFTKD